MIKVIVIGIVIGNVNPIPLFLSLFLHSIFLKAFLCLSIKFSAIMSVYQNIVEKVYQCITNHKHQSSEHANEYVIASLLGFSYCYEALTFNNISKLIISRLKFYLSLRPFRS